MRLSWKFLVLTTAITYASAAKEKTETKPSGDSASPPVFFLQDPTDGLCLAGEDFKRCSIDTLFYVVGTPGKYQVHKRPSTLGTGASDLVEEEGDGICLTKKSCSEKDNEKPQELKLGKCTHCGAKAWNILGESSTGYVLTEGDGKLCARRDEKNNKAVTVPCASTE